MEKLSSTKLVPGVKTAGDAALEDSRGGESMEGGGTWKPWVLR